MDTSHIPPARPLVRPTALADAAFEQLRSDLISGGPLTTRRRIVAGEVAHRLRMSRTPVREALDRLASLGYLEPLARGGYQRRRYRTRDRQDVHELRLLLEPYAAASAARLGDPIRPAGDVPFHSAIARASGNRVLAHVVELLAERVAAMRTEALEGRRPDPTPLGEPEAQRAHARIAEAVERGDADAARASMEEHLAAEHARLARHRSGAAEPSETGSA
jgi:DNA-binding GntR family transcriptional regulator